MEANSEILLKARMEEILEIQKNVLETQFVWNQIRQFFCKLILKTTFKCFRILQAKVIGDL